MPPQDPPDFASQAYWQRRFTSGEPSSGFEWLGLPLVFTSYIQTWLRDLDGNAEDATALGGNTLSLDVLHIGSGSSSLSFDLRSYLPPSVSPSRILNVDYAQAAVDWGKTREKETFEPAEGMRWEALDLLDTFQVVNLIGRPSCTSSPLLIIDKSTSDALSCGPSLFSPLEPQKNIDPLPLLALNLALVSPPQTDWLVQSYSQDRFAGVDLGGWWDVVQKELVDVPELGEEAKDDGVGRPKLQHGMVVLRRTEAQVSMP